MSRLVHLAAERDGVVHALHVTNDYAASIPLGTELRTWAQCEQPNNPSGRTPFVVVAGPVTCLACLSLT